MILLFSLVTVLTLAGCSLLACYHLRFGWTMVFLILLLIFTYGTAGACAP